MKYHEKWSFQILWIQIKFDELDACDIKVITYFDDNDCEIFDIRHERNPLFVDNILL